MYDITLIPGDGIGPEVAYAAKKVVDATGVKIAWDIQEAGADQMEKYGTPLPEHVLDSIRKNRVALKGPITTPVGTGFRSVNVSLRKQFDLYANLRPARTYKGVVSRYTDIDLVVVRENTEDLYAGVEHMVGKDAAESLKILTRPGCERIIRFAFDYARKEGRKKVTAVHKANPTATILSACLMLKHLGEVEAAQRIDRALAKVIAEGKTVTYDLGGSTTTSGFADALIAAFE